MPQLAPMNWMFLILFFWMNVFLMAVGVWWFKESIYMFSDKCFNKNFCYKKWSW